MSQDTGSHPESNDRAGSNGAAGGETDCIARVAKLRVSQNVAADVRKALLAIPVRKPAKHWFVRVRPGAEWRCETFVLELEEDRETYLISPALFDELSSESVVSPRLLVTAITKQGSLFLWPCKLPGPDGKLNAWPASMLEAIAAAEQRWVRVATNKILGIYDCTESLAKTISEPAWPDLTFEQILRTAFRGKIIDSPDHPVLRKLRDEV
jgi:hypothetical protein